MKNFGKSSQGLPKIFRAPVYRVHHAVIFATAQLSCCNYERCRQTSCTYMQRSVINVNMLRRIIGQMMSTPHWLHHCRWPSYC